MNNGLVRQICSFITYGRASTPTNPEIVGNQFIIRSILKYGGPFTLSTLYVPFLLNLVAQGEKTDTFFNRDSKIFTTSDTLINPYSYPKTTPAQVRYALNIQSGSDEFNMFLIKGGRYYFGRRAILDEHFTPIILGCDKYVRLPDDTLAKIGECWAINKSVVESSASLEKLINSTFIPVIAMRSGHTVIEILDINDAVVSTNILTRDPDAINSCIKSEAADICKKMSS